MDRNFRTLMAEAKFYESYARFDELKGRYETWEEAVTRVMDMHRYQYADFMTPELKEYIDFAEASYKSKEVLGAQRALQFGGEQLLKHNARLFNCLKKDTKFVTNKGVKSFEDFSDGDSCVVRSHTGFWRKAKVKKYGVQKLNRIHFNKNTKDDYIVYATPNHRWMLKDETFTDSLKEGDRLRTVDDVAQYWEWEEATPEEQLYWCYGFIYGDGTVGTNGYCRVRLCDTKRRFEYRFTDMGFSSSSALSIKGDIIISAGIYAKTLPDLEKDSEGLIFAFIRGYLDADGHKNNSGGAKQYDSIQITGKDTCDFIRKAFPVAGFYPLGETDLSGQETNYGIRKPYTVKFNLNEGLRSKFDKPWKVVKIEENVLEEEVWCLEVEEDHTFTLPNGMITGNCSGSYADRPEFFGECFYMMLCGCGVGFSVQIPHVAKLPKIQPRKKEPKTFIVPDSIEGWARSLDVLLSSFFVGGGVHQEYEGHQVYFDLQEIRPKGSYISGGFKAPGPEPLRIALDKIEQLLNSALKNKMDVLRPIDVYDITMYSADAVISGGVRRAATICMFSLEDKLMMKAKTGNWFVENPQRARSNNSVVLYRDTVSYQELNSIIASIKEYGEPGFVFSDDLNTVFNP